MTVISAGETARIYEFPSGRRRGDRRFEQPSILAELRPQPVVDYENWYHQDAISQEERPPKA